MRKLKKELVALLTLLGFVHQGTKNVDAVLGKIDGLVDQLNAAVDLIVKESVFHAEQATLARQEATEKIKQAELAALKAEAENADRQIVLSKKKDRAIRTAERIASLTA